MFGLIFATCVFVYLLGFKFPFTPFLNESDHHMFLYEGMRLFDGDVMYRDFFQFTFPGSQAFYWLMFSIFGLKYWILPATILLIAAFSAWICLKVSAQVITGWLSYLPAILFIFFGFRYEGLDATHRMFSPIFVTLAVWIVLRRRDVTGYLLAGACCSIASFFTQQRGGLMLIAIIIFMIIDGVKSGTPFRKIMQSVGLVSMSFAVLLLFLCGYFIYQAGADNFFYATFEYPTKYYRFATYNNFDILPQDLAKAFQISSPSKAFAALPVIFYLFVLPLGYLSFWLLFFFKRREHDWKFWRNITLVALIGTLLTFTTIAPNASRMFQIAMPGVIVFIWLLVYAKDHWNNVAARLIPATLTIAAVLVVSIGFIQAFRLQTGEYRTMTTPTGVIAYVPAPITDERYGWLLQRTKPGDLLFETYQPYIYFPLHLRNPTKYSQIWDTDYTRPEQVAETVADLEAKRPRYILWNNVYNKPPELRSAGDHTAPLADYIQQHYRPASETIENTEGRIQIWERVN